MDQQSFQPRRTDYQSLSSERRTRFNDAPSNEPDVVPVSMQQPIANAAVQPTPLSRTIPVREDVIAPAQSLPAEPARTVRTGTSEFIPIRTSFAEPLPKADDAKPMPTEHSFVAVTDTHHMLETGVEGLLDAEYDDEQPIAGTVASQATVQPRQQVTETTFNPANTTAAPTVLQTPKFQMSAPIIQKAPFYKTQKFWLTTSIVIFAILLLTGGVIGYKATHHAPDQKISRPTVAPVDTSSAVASVGNTTAEQTANQVRQKDILALRTALEAYYVDHVMYPTNGEMADPKWAVANLRDIKTENLKDPEGTIAALANVPTKLRYAYEAAATIDMNACDNASQNCNYYKLTVYLSDGTQYVKAALH